MNPIIISTRLEERDVKAFSHYSHLVSICDYLDVMLFTNSSSQETLI